MLLSAVYAVMVRSLIKSAIGLASASVILTLLMFKLSAPLAAVFELSICAGLITVVFVSTISLTQPLVPGENQDEGRRHRNRNLLLPVLLVLAAIGLALWKLPITTLLPPPEAVGADVRSVLWNERQLDLLGQVIILLTGVFGVVVLFKGRDGHE